MGYENEILLIYISILNQEETEWVGNTHVCSSKYAYSRDIWVAIHMGVDIFGFYMISLVIILHNYGRLSYTLIKSLRQNTQLIEGSRSE